MMFTVSAIRGCYKTWQTTYHNALRTIHTSTVSWSPVKTPDEAEKVFVKPDVQSYLRRLVGFDPEIVFQKRPIPKLKSPKYLFMTDEELKISLERVNKKGRKILELVPYKAPLEEAEPEILANNPEIQGYDDTDVVFTDISLGATDRTRLIVVREPNGILRRANRLERLRMNQFYYPIEGRLHYIPKMFEEEHLEEVLTRKEYIFVLDRACVQFEPDDPDYHRVTRRTFEVINENKDFDALRSNRYFGSLVFHLVINDCIDDLFLHFINHVRMQEAQLLLNLYYLIHTEGKESFDSLSEDVWKQFEYYITHSKRRPTLERSLQALKERLSNEQNLAEQEVEQRSSSTS